jgi:glycosyltransferase involved in cell wall biosynthesis
MPLHLDGITEQRVGGRVRTGPPAVSVIIPNYNTAKYIAETLESVLAQTYRDYEIIVINDAAPDSAELNKVLQPYLDDIVFIDKSRNEGTSATRNLAVGHARGEWIAFLDADDIWQPTYLQEQIAGLREHGYDMVYAAAELFGVSSQGGESLMMSNPGQSGDVTRQMLIDGQCHILPSGTVIKKSELLAVGGFDPGVARTEDFDLWMRLVFHGTRIGYVRKNLFKFRLRPGSGSGDSLQRLERCTDIWHVLKEKLPFTDDESAVIDRHLAVGNAAVLRARGRLYVHQRKWPEARECFLGARRKAKELGLPLKHRLKMSAVLLLLNVYPNLLLKLFRSLRADEVEYMPNLMPDSPVERNDK